MINIYLRVNGEKREIPKPEDQTDTFIDKICEELNFPYDVEVNLCLFGTLGKEIFLDSRLKDKITNEKQERLDKIVAGKTYPDLKLCYVCYSNILVHFWKTILHELHHFQDPYECSVDDYLTPMEEGNYIEPKKLFFRYISSNPIKYSFACSKLFGSWRSTIGIRISVPLKMSGFSMYSLRYCSWPPKSNALFRVIILNENICRLGDQEICTFFRETQKNGCLLVS